MLPGTTDSSVTLTPSHVKNVSLPISMRLTSLILGGLLAATPAYGGEKSYTQLQEEYQELEHKYKNLESKTDALEDRLEMGERDLWYLLQGIGKREADLPEVIQFYLREASGPIDVDLYYDEEFMERNDNYIRVLDKTRMDIKRNLAELRIDPTVYVKQARWEERGTLEEDFQAILSGGPSERYRIILTGRVYGKTISRAHRQCNCAIVTAIPELEREREYFTHSSLGFLLGLEEHDEPGYFMSKEISTEAEWHPRSVSQITRTRFEK